MKKLLVFIAMTLLTSFAIAQDFAIKNTEDQILYFKILSDSRNELSLVRGKYKYNDESYIIPKSIEYDGKKWTVVEIGQKAFYERSSLKNISLPSTIQRIQGDAFEDCEFISFIFPDSLKSIGDGAFNNTFIGKSNLDKQLNKVVGKYYTTPFVKGGYRLYMAQGKSIIFKNDVTGVERSFPISRIDNFEDDLFSDDIQSYYQPILTKVERTDNPEDRYGGIKEVNKDDVDWFNFSDDYIDLEISGLVNRFNFTLANKTSNTIKIVWDDAVFVNVDGNTSKIMHSGIKYSERENAQVPSTIIRNSKLTDVIIPNVFVKYSEILKEWGSYDDLPISDVCEGKTITIMLPIQIKDVVNEYILEFTLLYLPLHPERLNSK